MGPWRFIILWGVIAWGLPTAVLFSLVMSLALGDTDFLQVLPTALVAFPIGGAVWGAVMWALLVRRWRSLDQDGPA
jgi:hypothetical protein